LAVEIAQTFDLSNAAAAQRYLEQNHPAGKLVMTL
jgi:NADPH2:quinone reductase